MLFEFVSGLVDIVRERPYEGVVTLRSSRRETIEMWESVGPGKVLKVPHHLYPWILHLAEGNLDSDIRQEDLKNIEVVDRLTPEPVAFAVEWTYKNEEGFIVSGYDYCWPQDTDVAANQVSFEYDNLVDTAKFLPLFEIPNKLLGLED
jgi:hypothetical protein